MKFWPGNCQYASWWKKIHTTISLYRVEPSLSQPNFYKTILQNNWTFSEMLVRCKIEWKTIKLSNFYRFKLLYRVKNNFFGIRFKMKGSHLFTTTSKKLMYDLFSLFYRSLNKKCAAGIGINQATARGFMVGLVPRVWYVCLVRT